MSRTRRARVRALAKINLDLRVLGQRADGYHELRTIFQTISLADTIDLAFTPGRATRVEMTSVPHIPDNLVLRAARLAFDAMRVTGSAEFGLVKRIPAGAGLGGGSSDAAAVLLALPVLAGRRLSAEVLLRLAAALGSDVPFFLLGGTAAGLGRGGELYPLPDAAHRAGVLVCPEVHVSTADAYRALSPRLTIESAENKIVSFQSQVWKVVESGASGEMPAGSNDFEPVVFEQFPELALLRKRLARLCACPTLMTGSGSAIFGLYDNRAQAARAVKSLREERGYCISLVSRAKYRSLWWRWLRPHLSDKLWPPPSRYAR